MLRRRSLESRNFNRRSNRFENKHTHCLKEIRRFKETRCLRRRFESFNGQDTFDETYSELQKVAKELVKEYGEEVTDEINVVFWAKDQVGTPCLVNGTYNSWSGDEELTITEIASGIMPERFLSKLDKCFVDVVPWIAENCAGHVIAFVNDDYGLDLSFGDVKESCFDGILDYEALYAYIVENFGDIDDDEDEFVSKCQDRWESDYFDDVYSFGWEYSTVTQGNLFYGRSNSDFAKGCTFLVSVNMFGETDDCSYAGETRIDKKGLEKLAKKVLRQYKNQHRKESYSLRNEAYNVDLNIEDIREDLPQMVVDAFNRACKNAGATSPYHTCSLSFKWKNDSTVILTLKRIRKVYIQFIMDMYDEVLVTYADNGQTLCACDLSDYGSADELARNIALSIKGCL